MARMRYVHIVALKRVRLVPKPSGDNSEDPIEFPAGTPFVANYDGFLRIAMWRTPVVDREFFLTDKQIDDSFITITSEWKTDSEEDDRGGSGKNE